MVVAGILAAWATQFVQQQRSELQFCGKAKMLLQRAYYDSTNKNLTLMVYNYGDVPLKGFTMQLSFNPSKDEIKIVNDNRTIDAQQVSSFVIDNVSATLEEVWIRSLQCEGAQDTNSKYDIQGLGYPTY
jgi:hypothetical protein